MLGTALALLTLWMLIQLVNDHYRWSQYLFWFPSLTLLLPAAALWTSGTMLRAASGIRRSSLDWLTGLGCAVVALHLATIDYRLQNLVVRAGAGSDHAIRVLNWNASGIFDANQLLEPIQAQEADVVITVDACCHREWTNAAHLMDPRTAVLFSRNLQLMSRFRILRHAQMELDIPAPEPLIDEDQEDRRILGLLGRFPLLRHTVPPDGLRARPDPGRAWYIEIDTVGPLGRPIVIWVIDMPSDLRLGRADIAAHAFKAIQNWEGHETILSQQGVQANPARGFPKPDLILGDFNTPRRSASLRQITLNYPHAHAQAGYGHSGTYPRHRPLAHIDHMFVGPRLRTRTYKVIDPGAGSHRMQVAEFEAASR